MRPTHNLLLAGMASLTLAASAGLALAQTPAFHHMTVLLPDGETAQIQYLGAVAPKITLTANPFAAEFDQPAWPFASLDRISAEMDRQMDALMRQADTTMPLWAEPMSPARIPLGASSYSAVAAQAGSGGFCMQTMQITGAGRGHPKIISHSYGHCRSLGPATFSAAPFVSRARHDRGTIEAKAQPKNVNGFPSLQEAVYRPR